MNEIWKSVCGHPNYQISSLGRIKSLSTKRRFCCDCGVVQGKYLKPLKKRHGYFSVVLNGKHLLIHRLMAVAFLPNPKKLPFVNHKNSNRADYRLENLEWVTASENMLHAIQKNRIPLIIRSRAGLDKVRGESHGCAKLKEKQCAEIYGLRGTHSAKDLANKYGVSITSIQRIINGKTWKHLNFSPRVS